VGVVNSSSGRQYIYIYIYIYIHTHLYFTVETTARKYTQLNIEKKTNKTI